MKIVVAPDKFKGTLNAREVAESIASGIPEYHDVILFPMADGGEGSIDIINENKEYQKIDVRAFDPLFRPINTYYFLSENNEIALIEMSKISGLGLLNTDEKNPLKTSSIGTGQIIKDALQRGAKEIYLFIGGSATNDAGIGMASALGYQFLGKNNQNLLPIGENLEKIEVIVSPEEKINTQIYVVCDVENVFTGPNGATKVYGRQKGANENQIDVLESGMISLNDLVKRQFGVDLNQLKGSGAAGGMGGGAYIFLNAIMKSGTQTVMELSDFDKVIQNADLLITGEGKIDEQSLYGKLIHGLAKKAGENEIEFWLVCGKNELNEDQIKSLGSEKLISLVEKEEDVDAAFSDTKKVIKQKVLDQFK